MRLFGDQSLFIKYWNTDAIPIYAKSNLPGKEEGISGSCIGGFNIAASIYSSEEKQIAAVEFIKYVTSKAVQKEFVMDYNYLTGISSIYDDQEVCEKVDCELYKTAQPVARPTKENEDYDEYSRDFKNSVYEFFYGDHSALESLQKAEDLTKIYYISLSTEKTPVGLIMFIVSLVIIAIICTSAIFLYIPRFKPFFQFLPNDFWIVSLIGIVMIQCINFTEYGQITVFKCHLKLLFLTIGYTLYMIPFLYKLIVNFPEENKIFTWIENNRYLFLLMFLLIDVALNLLLIIQPYSIKDIKVVDGQNFQYCKLDSFFKVFIEIVIFITKVMVLLLVLGFMFLEWSMNNVHHDLRYFITAIYINSLAIVLLLIINMFKINSYEAYFIMRILIYTINSLSTYLFLYAFRIIYCIFFKHFDDSKNINSMSESIRKSKVTSSAKFSTTATTDSKLRKSNLSLKVLDYHNNQQDKESIQSLNHLESMNNTNIQTDNNVVSKNPMEDKTNT